METLATESRREDLLVGIVGNTGSGKSLFINSYLGRKAAATASGVASCTRQTNGIGTLLPCGQKIIFFEAPGFGCYSSGKGESMGQLHILKEMEEALHESAPGASRFTHILILQDATATFEAPAPTAVEQRLMDKICPLQQNRLILVTTHWDKVRKTSPDDEQTDIALSNCFLHRWSRKRTPRTPVYRSGLPLPDSITTEGYLLPRALIHKLFEPPISVPKPRKPKDSTRGIEDNGVDEDYWMKQKQELDKIYEKLVWRLEACEEKLENVTKEKKKLEEENSLLQENLRLRQSPDPVTPESGQGRDESLTGDLVEQCTKETERANEYKKKCKYANGLVNSLQDKLRKEQEKNAQLKMQLDSMKADAAAAQWSARPESYQEEQRQKWAGPHPEQQWANQPHAYEQAQDEEYDSFDQAQSSSSSLYPHARAPIQRGKPDFAVKMKQDAEEVRRLAQEMRRQAGLLKNRRGMNTRSQTMGPG